MKKSQINKFNKDEKVKTKYGEIRTVAYQKDIQVFVNEELNIWYHPNNLMKIK